MSIISFQDVSKLREDEQESLNEACAFVNAELEQAFHDDPSAKAVVIDTGELSKAIGGLPLRIRNHLCSEIGAPGTGWKVTDKLDEGKLVIKRKKVYGPRKPKDEAATETGDDAETGEENEHVETPGVEVGV